MARFPECPDCGKLLDPYGLCPKDHGLVPSRDDYIDELLGAAGMGWRFQGLPGMRKSDPGGAYWKRRFERAQRRLMESR